jgi:N-terminal domain of (some) glycogen debranching enzymes/Mannosylglycerate hydrolase MGH1-like glycoside hydrolase domain
MPHPSQPYVHDLTTLVAAPTQVLSQHDGQIVADTDGPSAEGVIHADIRVLSRAIVTVDGEPGQHIATELDGGDARFTSILRHVGRSVIGDPQVALARVRRVQPGNVTENLVIASLLPSEASMVVTVTMASDAATMAAIRTGRPAEPRPMDAKIDLETVSWSVGELSAAITAPDAELGVSQDARELTISWPLTLAPGGQRQLSWTLTVADGVGPVIAAPTAPLPSPVLVSQPEAPADERLASWLARSIDDLNSLRVATPERPEDTFLAAGAPWYLTLFGRDSIWAARMLLPLDVRLARGTLRTLARLQGTRVDPVTAEQPGKILHELRRDELVRDDGRSLPPVYYGTIDATPLWICLLHDAWLAGLADADVTDLLPALRGALSWLTHYGDADGDGFLEYHDPSGRGLANQGWKDSADSVRFANGRIAQGPIALCEVQGYAYEAAMSGAALLDAFGQPGAEGYRRWAGILAERFRTSFWCGDGDERYPALALDGSKRQVDSLTSNIGHLLGTGILDREEELLVARRVSDDALNSGLGLRTMADTDAGYAPLSYHCGSVWPHDTAIVIAGLYKAGLEQHADGLVEGLLRAAVAFDHRLPELWSGEGRPVPYPMACRPQAWSAAAAVVVAGVLEALP